MMNMMFGNDPSRFEEAIEQLNAYVSEESLKPFIAILESLVKEPNNEDLLTQLGETFKGLGIEQGAVLTHAPSIYEFIVGDLFND